MVERRTEEGWQAVRGQQAVMLTTYRRDGRSVATPVGYGIEGSTLYFMTDSDAGKVKRLRHTPSVTLAASTLRGRVTGPAVAGVATRVTGAEAERGRRRITATNRVAWFFLMRRARRAGRDWAVYAVRRDSTATETDHPHVSDAAVSDTARTDSTRTDSTRTDTARTDTQEIS